MKLDGTHSTSIVSVNNFNFFIFSFFQIFFISFFFNFIFFPWPSGVHLILYVSSQGCMDVNDVWTDFLRGFKEENVFMIFISVTAFVVSDVQMNASLILELNNVTTTLLGPRILIIPVVFWTFIFCKKIQKVLNSLWAVIPCSSPRSWQGFVTNRKSRHPE